MTMRTSREEPKVGTEGPKATLYINATLQIRYGKIGRRRKSGQRDVRAVAWQPEALPLMLERFAHLHILLDIDHVIRCYGLALATAGIKKHNREPAP